MVALLYKGVLLVHTLFIFNFASVNVYLKKMAQLKIYNEIVDEETKVMYRDWFGTDGVCYKDITDFLEKMEEGDNNIELLIHCPGGNCLEGWAIYDKLRQSGKQISATIEGNCSSMATIILLAAPKETICLRECENVHPQSCG